MKSETQSELDILRHMRADLEKPGAWCQGQYSTDGGAHCLLGARTMAAGAVDYHQVTAHRLANLLGLRITAHQDGFDAVTKFNDAPRRTQAEVLEKIDKAIARLESAA